MDSIIQTEILLNYLNNLLAKSVAFNDLKATHKLEAIRHTVYYGDFDFGPVIKKLDELNDQLKKYG